MPYLNVRHYPNMRLAVVSVTSRRPPQVSKDGLTVAFCTELSHEAALGAERFIDDLDILMGPRCKQRGIYQVAVKEVLDIIEETISKHGAPPAYPMYVRYAAGATAVALLCLMIALAIPAAIVWLAVCAFKRQSGLTTMAETAVVYSIFDWSRLIRKLGRIALNGR